MEKFVVFDFDGTLTQKGQNAWQSIWQSAGYSIGEGSEYRKLFSEYINGNYSYKEWNDRTCEYLRKGNLSSIKVYTIGARMPSMKGIKNTLKTLRENGYKLIIVSGSIKQVIKSCLKDNMNYFSAVYANDFLFDSNGILEKINPTRFDFDGKKRFIELLITSGVNAKNITFVGNSYNDEKVGETGVKTICINPETENHTNKEIWTNVVRGESISKILPFIIEKNNKIENKIELNY